MLPTTFKALVVDQAGNAVHAEIREVPVHSLPDDDVLISVDYSSLNYKDGLAIQGKGKVIRTFPMIPGVDLVGTVVESQSSAWKSGDAVICTGWGMGEHHWGGYAQLARVPTSWLVSLPGGLSPWQAMALGTAGLTAMLALIALEEHGLKPDAGKIVVTGAAGGVGSLAVVLLAASGYTVVASSGRSQLHDYLRSLGAHEIVDRELLSAPSFRPLESARWAGAIDTVGGDTLAGLLRMMSPGASIAACGNAGGAALHTTVLPFILRGLSLLGIDSNYCPLQRRQIAWTRLSREMPSQILDAVARTFPLTDVLSLSDEILRGRLQGRAVVNPQGS